MIWEDLSPRSGSRRFLFEATPRLNKLGHDVRIFTTKLDTKMCYPEILQLPVEVVAKRQSSVSHFFKRVINRDLDYFWIHARAYMEISKRAAKWKPDILIFHYAGEPWLPQYFYYLDKPVGIVDLHVIPGGVPSSRTQILNKVDQKIRVLPPMGRWNALSLRKVRMFITHSHFVYDQAMEVLGNKISKMTEVVPLGVNHSEFYPTDEEEPFVLCLGRIDPQKTLELTIKAMKDIDPHYSLVIAGALEDRYAWYKHRLIEFAEKMNLRKRFKIVLAPNREEVVRLIQRCSVFLFPSTIDTFGLTVLEAMACGKPIVACKAGGIPELLGDCGVLLEADPEIWHDVLRQLLSDSSYRRKIGKKAFERSKLYTWEHTVNSLTQALQNFLVRTKQ